MVPDIGPSRTGISGEADPRVGCLAREVVSFFARIMPRFSIKAQFP